jgi:hypoxanthine phosphoribosyltransferase
MKLNNYFILVIIFLIFIYHYFIQNKIEKTFFDCLLGYNFVKRPFESCQSEINNNLSCLGFPSGHAETATLIGVLLYFQKMISFNLCIILIILISLHRIIFKFHTPIQVFIGIIFGFIYSQIYLFTNLSIYSFLIVFLIGLLLSILIVYKIEQRLKQPIPLWVNRDMIPSIQKKLETPYFFKIASVYANVYNDGKLFISWSEIEKYLDLIIEKIKTSGINYDAVVGIKTGGAIISDYISQKLGITNYKIKLSRSDYNCHKKYTDTINDLIQKKLLKNFGHYSICHGIEEDLTGKNIILIDEMVNSGTTMLESIKYLRNSKHVNIIYPTCISLSTKTNKENVFINTILKKLVAIWAWGYDN